MYVTVQYVIFELNSTFNYLFVYTLSMPLLYVKLKYLEYWIFGIFEHLDTFKFVRQLFICVYTMVATTKLLFAWLKLQI